jgi:hypothetical protein
VLNGFDFTRPLLALTGIGCAQSTLDLTAEYVRTGSAFGSPLSRFEGVLVPAGRAPDHARGRAAALLLGALAPDGRGAAHRRGRHDQVVRPAHGQPGGEGLPLLHGNYGYSEEFSLEQRLRDVMAVEIADGTAQIQKIIIARERYGRTSCPTSAGECADRGRRPLPAGVAEAAFGVGEVAGDRTLTRGFMRTGPWSIEPDGTPCPGSLGVLIDDVLGYAVVSARPPGHWAVSTEIHVDYCRPLPGPGARLRAESSAVEVGPVGGLASGVVTDAEGSVIATATERLQYVLGEPSGLSEAGAPVLGGSGGGAVASVLDLLDGLRRGTVEPGRCGSRRPSGWPTRSATCTVGCCSAPPSWPAVGPAAGRGAAGDLVGAPGVPPAAPDRRRGAAGGHGPAPGSDAGPGARGGHQPRGQGVCARHRDRPRRSLTAGQPRAPASRRMIAAASAAIAGTNSATSTRSWMAEAT